MKKSTKILIFVSIILGLLYVLIYLPFEYTIGEIYIPNANKTYLKFYFKEEFREFKKLNFDFYRNDSLMIDHRYFVDKDSPPEVRDFHLFQYKNITYITLYDSTKIKIICDEKLNIIYPCFGCSNFSKDSIEQLPKIREMIKNNNLELNRW